MRILVTGPSGLVGSALVPALEQAGHDVLRLTRTPSAAGSTIILWDPEASEILETERLDHLDAIVHLAGENVGSGRWTPQKKAAIRNSRVQGTGLVARTIAALEHPPHTFICASATGYYGDRGDEELDEQSALGESFLSGVCRDWEEAAAFAADAGVRTVVLRIGFILSAAGGGLAKMLPPFRAGLGGTMGSGKQWMSWIALDDVIGVIQHALGDTSLHGPVNTVAPQPVTNREFTRALGRVLHRPTLLPMPAFAARLALGEMADDLLLASAKVLPAVLNARGYSFRFPTLEGALEHLLGQG